MRILQRTRMAVAAVAAALITTGALTVGAASSAPAATAPRVNLGMLVVSDGTPWVQAIQQQLSSEGVPVTVVNLGDSGRPTIDSSYLSGTLSDGTPVGKFQGVVLPNDAPQGLSADERTALASYESQFSVRQVDAYTYPTGNVGMNAPTYAGSLDGSAATVTTAAKNSGFAYLKGTFNFDGKPGGNLSYGYLGTPLPNTSTATFTPYLTETIPGTTTTGTLAGVYSTGGREQMEVSFGYNNFQLQYRYLAHGIVDWLTRGVHFGYWRNYLTVDADDVFNADAEWSQQGNCTPGDSTCPPGTPDTTPSRMTAGRRHVRHRLGEVAQLQARTAVQRRSLVAVPGPRGRPAGDRVPAAGQPVLVGQPHLHARVARLRPGLHDQPLELRDRQRRQHPVGGLQHDQRRDHQEPDLGEAERHPGQGR